MRIEKTTRSIQSFLSFVFAGGLACMHLFNFCWCYSSKAGITLPSLATWEAKEGSIAERTLRSVLGESSARITNSATSSRWMLPIAVTSSVRMAVPVIGSETSPPGRIIDQFEFLHMFMSMFSAFSFSSKESFTTSKTLGGAAALDEPLLVLFCFCFREKRNRRNCQRSIR
jgi:hypothetical protein